MSHKDHLDKETSVSVTLKKTGIEGNAKSRLISGIDRLGGNLTELLNVPIEKITNAGRNKIEAQNKLTKAATDILANSIKDNPELAHQILAGSFSQSERRYKNKEQVVTKAVEQLQLSPPSNDQQESGTEELSPEFLNRFERYAEDASTEEIRSKWANALAAEVRMPGTFDNKVMRILDEIDSKTAKQFQQMSTHRVSTDIPKWLYDPQFMEATQFTDSGLINENSLGVIKIGSHGKDHSGRDVFGISFGSLIISTLKENAEQNVKAFNCKDLIVWNEKNSAVAIPIVSTTMSGSSLMEIMPDNSVENAKKMVKKIREFDPHAELIEVIGDGKFSIIDF